VAISGDTVVVGADVDGSAYVFVHTGTNWTQQAYLKASNTETGDSFGSSVAVAGDTLVVGASWEDSNATGVNGDQSDNSAPGAGAAYVFVRHRTNWAQQAYLKASNTGGGLPGERQDGDHFGSVAVSGDTVVVGAYQEDSNARGVNGNQSNNSLHDTGAAYVFVRNGTNWTQQAYLKASNSGLEDLFGVSVAVSGGTVVVGATGESSSATGVNGNQSDNNAGFAGAAYVFTGVGIGPQLAVERDGSAGYFLLFTGAPEITYRLQRAPSVTGPWSDIATNTAPASGLIEYHETAPPPGAAFYRTAKP
jgi:hypothetical protein